VKKRLIGLALALVLSSSIVAHAGPCPIDPYEPLCYLRAEICLPIDIEAVITDAGEPYDPYEPLCYLRAVICLPIEIEAVITPPIEIELQP